MIPKIIHYCWFGKGPKPELAEKCIASWKKNLPEYQYIEWNEDNFDFNLFPYAKQALEVKKYAFVADVARIYALKEIGGIYLDTDVELLKPLDVFLHHKAFLGFESDGKISTALIGSQKNSQFVRDVLYYYEGKNFLDKKNNPILIPNTTIITEILREKDIILKNSSMEIDDYIALYPDDFFSPKDYLSKKINVTKNTVSIHHFDGSWLSQERKIKDFILRFFNFLLGKKGSDFISNMYAKIRK